MPRLTIYDRRYGTTSRLTCTDLVERDQLVAGMVETIERDPDGCRGQVERLDAETVAIHPPLARIREAA